MPVVRFGTPDDAPRIQQAYHAHHDVRSAVEWRWPDGATCLVAEVDGEVVAFAALRKHPLGVLVDELWQIPGRAGLVGLDALGNALLSWSDDHREAIGGLVALDNAAHRAALERRGFTARCLLYVRDPAPVEATA